MKRKFIFVVSVLILLFLSYSIQAEKISGFVKAESEKHTKPYPIVGASVFWENTSIGTTTDVTGFFELERSELTNTLIVAFVGFDNDTIKVDEIASELNILLTKGFEIEEVTVTGNQIGQFISSLSIEAKQVITTAGLNKLPCCNLSESFENNGAVDVSYSDAISGAKQIKMLGLAGIYSQILRENMPAVRGLSAYYGLSFIPGTWMESVQISKGSAAVVNGYESTTGQINIELKKPENSEPLFFNLYANSEGKIETNLTSAFKLNEKVSTMFYLHASRLDFLHDQNNDGFVDMPLMSQYNFLNRWKINNNGKLDAQFGIRFLLDEREGGQMNYFNNSEANEGLYSIGINIRQYEAFAKLGFLIPGTDHSSVGSMYSISRHEQNSFFGNKTYSGIHNSFYANVIIQTIIKTTANNLSFGGSMVYDDFDEKYNDVDFSRKEIVPGVFGQYTYVIPEKFSMIAGIRTDFHNLYGVFFTPRLHLKYEFTGRLTLRSSAGKGYRTANVFAENPAILASSRVLIIEEEFKPEEAWNYGINLTSKFNLSLKKELIFNLDFYRTDFVNQIVADVNADVHQIRFYNLNGRSYSNSFQAEVSLEPFKRFDISAAFRYNDVKISMNDELIEKPFVNKYRGVVSISYATNFKKWMFDITNQFVGTSQLPVINENFTVLPEGIEHNDKSPSYYILHAQVTKRFKRLDIYVGAENLTNYHQENLIIDAENPFDENFDASMIWGPVFGRKFYAGLRFKL